MPSRLIYEDRAKVNSIVSTREFYQTEQNGPLTQMQTIDRGLSF